MPTKYTDNIIMNQLLAVARSVGAMPTMSELVACGHQHVANYICRHGGVRRWA